MENDEVCKDKTHKLDMENIITVDDDFDMQSLLDDSLPSSCETASSISHE